MPDVVLVKLGGSLLTDKKQPRTAREEIIERLAKEVTQVRKAIPEALVLGHGSGSFGHDAARRYSLKGRLATSRQRRGVSVTQVRAAQLHRRVVDALLEAGAAPFSIAPSSGFLAAGGRTAIASVEPLQRALELGLLPVVYGDVVLDRRLGATVLSTETVLREIIVRLQRRTFRVRKVLWMGETDGIYDRQGRTIAEVTARNLEEVRESIGPTRGTDVTGGMELRLEAAWEIARKGIDSFVLDGRQPGLLKRCLSGKPVGGTLVRGRRTPQRSRQRARNVRAHR